MRALDPGPPSPRRGAQQALLLSHLVAAVWVASWLAIAPALLVLSRTVSFALAPLPGGPGEAPGGDIDLIILEAVQEAWTPLAMAALCGVAGWWAWTVLWHAGIVRWQLRPGGQRARLSDLLGVGVAAWWRYARLSATALVALATAAAAVWLPLWWGVAGAIGEMTEQRLFAAASAGALATAFVGVLVWLATLHGAWLLGLPGRRSAALAWLAGLRSTLRRPWPCLGAWLVWAVPALLASALVPLLGGAFAGLRGGLLLVVVGLLASLLRAFCWVGLFCSFGPVNGLVGISEAQPEAGDGSAGQGREEEDGRGLAGDEPPAGPGVTVSNP